MSARTFSSKRLGPLRAMTALIYKVFRRFFFAGSRLTKPGKAFNISALGRGLFGPLLRAMHLDEPCSASSLGRSTKIRVELNKDNNLQPRHAHTMCREMQFENRLATSSDFQLCIVCVQSLQARSRN